MTAVYTSTVYYVWLNMVRPNLLAPLWRGSMVVVWGASNPYSEKTKYHIKLSYIYIYTIRSYHNLILIALPISHFQLFFGHCHVEYIIFPSMIHDFPAYMACPSVACPALLPL